MAVPVGFGYICPHCGKATSIETRIAHEETDKCEMDVFECPHCGEKFSIIFYDVEDVDLEKNIIKTADCDLDGKYKRGTFAPYCPKCFRGLSWDDLPDEGTFKCPHCGAELEVKWISAEDAIAELEKAIRTKSL